LLSYIGAALHRREVIVKRITWSPPDDASSLWVAQQVGAVLCTTGHRTLVVGKSLGTLAAPLAAAIGRQLPGIWLTPLLNERFVVNSLRRASQPQLLIGGTADQVGGWEPALARSLSPYVYEVPDGDHDLLVPGPLANSARVLGQVITEVEWFLDKMVFTGWH